MIKAAPDTNWVNSIVCLCSSMLPSQLVAIVALSIERQFRWKPCKKGKRCKINKWVKMVTHNPWPGSWPNSLRYWIPCVLFSCIFLEHKNDVQMIWIFIVCEEEGSASISIKSSSHSDTNEFWQSKERVGGDWGANHSPPLRETCITIDYK